MTRRRTLDLCCGSQRHGMLLASHAAMPISYRVHSISGVVVVRASDVLSSDDFDRYFAETDCDPLLHNPMHRLIVFAPATRFPDSASIKSIVKLIRARSYLGSTSFAIVACEPLAMGMANCIFGQAGLLDQMRIFEDFDTAWAWLASRNRRINDPMALALVSLNSTLSRGSFGLISIGDM